MEPHFQTNTVATAAEISASSSPAWIDPVLGKILANQGSPLLLILLLIWLLRSLTRFIQVCKEN
jgi:hypothetical protein